MEDAAEAIKMAFAVFMFILAMGLAFLMFDQSRRVSDIVISKNDNTYLELYRDADLNHPEWRLVGAEDLVPTLYRYYKQRYSIDVKNSSGKVESAFDLEVERKVYDELDDYQPSKTYVRDHSVTYKTLYPTNIHWFGSSPNRDSKLRVDNYVSKGTKGTPINGEDVKPSMTNFNFSDTYRKTFEDNYTGKKASSVPFDSDEYDGTYLIVDETGQTKLHLSYQKE